MDADVVVLGVTASQKLSAQIWIQLGVGKSMRFILAYKIASSLGPDRSMIRTPYSMHLRGVTRCQLLMDVVK